MLFLLRFFPQFPVRNYDIRNTLFLQLRPKQQVFLAITFLKNDEIRLVKRSIDGIKLEKFMQGHLLYAIDLLLGDIQQGRLMPHAYLRFDVFRNDNANSAERIVIYCGNVKNDHITFLPCNFLKHTLIEQVNAYISFRQRFLSACRFHKKHAGTGK